MSKEFVDFLISEKTIADRDMERVRELVKRGREPIGSIAFSYGLMTSDDVDLIMSEQRREHRQFGEIATSLGILTSAQVDALVRVQSARGAIEIAEALVLSGLGSPDVIYGALGRFMAKGAENRRGQKLAA